MGNKAIRKTAISGQLVLFYSSDSIVVETLVSCNLNILTLHFMIFISPETELVKMMICLNTSSPEIVKAIFVDNG